jgi:hypothetical protein
LSSVWVLDPVMTTCHAQAGKAFNFANQHLCQGLQPLTEPANHIERQRALVCQSLINAIGSAFVGTVCSKRPASLCLLAPSRPSPSQSRANV